ncbi:TrkH family potassium uptake protein [Corynebacterium flavescens]|uniref:TrkH family potassium uptake protein n=1 Tax=Corynebacterium flavescens TaxID=28028 RepID=UPI002648E98F|nr:potassium transporter TrkG [Corynebacterium flavescens]MDN6200508.1 TrkH family potassium uptake protein [Corynebacterium flavescens]MDN6646673.1 TrkH family potassium uptake protein [Corynebacterium flavescens]
MERKSPSSWLRPAQLAAAGFLGLILVGAFVLTLPFASADGQFTPFRAALFTATSAVSLTGLIVVDTGSYWSFTGQATVLSLIQLGGFGIMSLTSLTGMLLTGRISLRSRQATAAEGRPLSLGGIRKTLMATLVLTVVCEAVVALTVGLRFATTYEMSPLRATWEGIFHAISAFNNAGFGLRADSLMPYASDAWVLVPLAGAFIIGGLGYPVLAELVSRVRDRIRARLRGVSPGTYRLSVTTRMTLVGTGVLIVAGTIMVAAIEWNGVLRDMSLGTKWLTAFFQGTAPRTAGFNSVDYAEMNPVTLMGTDILMFIGGGSAGTAGGIKITTAIVLLAAMVAEFQGQRDTSVGRRRIPHTVVRQAMTVAAAGIGVVTLAVGALRILEPQFTADQLSFEVISAFATVGLSTGITADLSAPSQIILCLLMYLGRVGPITLVAALAARNVVRRFNYPTERPFIG